jgi:SAM-dependent methyltransferase
MMKHIMPFRFPKLKIPGNLVESAYRFFDIESAGEAAKPDSRVIEYAFVMSKLAGMKPGKILDVGCAARGNYLPACLVMLGWEVWGIDRRIWQFEFPNFHFVRGDIRKTAFADDFFDCVYALSTLEHIGLAGRYGTERDDPHADIEARNEIARVLCQQGRFLITVPYGREYKVIKPLNRIYNRHKLNQLFDQWQIIEEIIYVEDRTGAWTTVTEETMQELSSDKEAIALIEATL